MNSAWIQNEYYKLSTPIPAPRPFKGFTWLASKAECIKCGRGFTQALRVHQVHMQSFLSDVVIHKQMPSEEKLATSFMIKACENGVGCWETCRPWKHLKECSCLSLGIGECSCKRSPDCNCKQGCGNKGIYPCQCGKMFSEVGGKHNLGCPTGLVKRVSSFAVDYMRSQMVGHK